jgi:hypothetical protein
MVKPGKSTNPTSAVQSAPPPPIIRPDISGIPVRTVLYVDVTALEPDRARLVCRELTKTFATTHPHFVVPVRNNRITSDLQFENEFLEVVKQLCEVKDNEIVLKGTAQEVEVFRLRV